MKTDIIKIDKNDIKEEQIEKAANIIRREGLVAFPTETVYGLGANAFSEEAAGKIYAAKGRPSDNPLIVHIGDLKMVDRLAREVSTDARKVMEAFWPGPFTVVLKKLPEVPSGTTGGLDTVAIRMPDHPIALALINQADIGIAAPSANLSGRPSPTLAEHVIEDLSGQIDMIIDGGPVGIGIESTILDLTGEIPTILRPGFITKAMIEACLGKDIITDPAIIGESTDQAPKAPGMKYKHYSPKGDLILVMGDSNRVAAKIDELASEKIRAGYRVGIIATEETAALYQNKAMIKTIGTRQNEQSISASLYRILRECDQDNLQFIFSEGFAGGNFGAAIMNRMLKAAGNHIIEV